MAATSPEKIVIFDYSGTLSIEAPRFARPENLIRALSETGLASLGVATPEVFWGEIVGPTWSEGSTTGAGYKNLIAEKVRGLRPEAGVPETEIAAASARFVDRYLAHSRIDPHWRPLLSCLTETPDACGIIATDHYAEATGAILGFLRAWDIQAVRVSNVGTEPFFSPSDEARAGKEKNEDRHLFPIPGSKSVDRPLFSAQQTQVRGQGDFKTTGVVFPYYVANSADLGFWKADRRFWEILRSRFSQAEVLRVLKEKAGCPPFPETVPRILIVDDFGFNEEAGDSYGQREKVLARQEKTVGLLREVFHAEVKVIPFFIERAERDSPEAWSRRIDEATARIHRFLL
jgi:hypothetical protein